MFGVESTVGILLTAAASVVVIPLGVWLLLRPLYYLAIFIGLLFAFVVVLVACNLVFGWLLDVYFPPPPRTRRVDRSLSFSTPAAWHAALTRDQWSHTPPRSLPPLIPQHPSLSANLNELLIFIVRDFVLKWYTDISSSPAFPTAVSGVLHSSLQNVLKRVNSVEGPDLIVYKILPAITRHVEHFRESESVVRGVSVERHLTRSEELDILLASRYAGTGKLHQAIANLSVISTRQSEEEYLRSVAERILVHVLPEREAQSKAVLIVVREIVACCVLAPLMEMLADPDFWNKMIDQLVSADFKFEASNLNI
jgi:sorting nexin-25